MTYSDGLKECFKIIESLENDQDRLINPYNIRYPYSNKDELRKELIAKMTPDSAADIIFYKLKKLIGDKVEHLQKVI